jgi:hypothetical protein
MATDLLLGGVTGGVGGRVGALAQTSNRPYTIAQLRPNVLGETSEFGDISIRPGLSRMDFEETLRHETVHQILTPKTPGFLNNAKWFSYERTHLGRYLEEAAAESYGALNPLKGMAFPLTHDDYAISPLRLAAEASGAGGVIGGLGYGGYKLAEGVFGDDQP